MTGPKTNERDGTRAVLRHSGIAPNKVREVLELIREKPVQEAEDILRFSERDAAFVVGKLLQSAVANAEHNDEADPESLYVATAYADEGTTQKRWRPRARGRATRIRKRTSHITLIVARLPEDQLARLVARRRAEQLAQRSRRVAGARRAEGDTRTRAQRRGNEPVEAPAAEEVPAALVAAEAEEQGIVDQQAEALAAADAGEITETAADTELAEAVAATPAGQLAAEEEEAGIVDPQAEALAAIEADEADTAATETTDTAATETEDGK